MKKKTLALILTLCMTMTAVVSFAAGAAAVGGLQAITAYLNSGVTIELKGEEQVLTDASGLRTFPINYNNTTYLPIRCIANLLGLEVDWDQATQTIKLDGVKGVDLIDTYKNFHIVGDGIDTKQYQSSDGKTKDISGYTCSNWLVMVIHHWNPAGYADGFSFNVGGKYDTLTFKYYVENYDSTIQVLGDNGALLFERDAVNGQIAQEVTVPLYKANQITIQITGAGTAYVFDAYLDAE